jgi:hypothetical protein
MWPPQGLPGATACCHSILYTSDVCSHGVLFNMASCLAAAGTLVDDDLHTPHCHTVLQLTVCQQHCATPEFIVGPLCRSVTSGLYANARVILLPGCAVPFTIISVSFMALACMFSAITEPQCIHQSLAASENHCAALCEYSVANKGTFANSRLRLIYYSDAASVSHSKTCALSHLLL